MDPHSHRSAILKGFETVFSASPVWLASAPGRVNILGEHVDYNDGFVLPMAIAQRTTVAAAPNRLNRCRVFSQQAQAGIIELPVSGAEERKCDWTDYLSGVLREYSTLFSKRGGLDLYYQSTIPIGAGLSSSAALEVGTALSVEAAWGVSLSDSERALLCQRAENNFVGMPCGIMDQFACVFSREDHLLKLDCSDSSFELIPFEQAAVNFLVIDSKVHHELVEGHYRNRREGSRRALDAMNLKSYRDGSQGALEASRGRMSDSDFRRGRHVLSEIERVKKGVECLRDWDAEAFGELMYQSHASLRDDYEVSCRELDFIVEKCRQLGRANGVYGARMTGGGFGGSAVALVKKDNEPGLKESLREQFELRFGHAPDFYNSGASRGAESHLVAELTWA